MSKGNFSRFFLPSIIKDFALLYKIAIFSIIVVGILLTKFSLDKQKNSVENKIINISEQINKIISYDIDYVKYQLSYASNQISEMRGDKAKIEKLLATFVTNINNQTDVALTWNAFSWIDADNMLTVDGTAGILSRPINLSFREYLKLTPLNKDTIIFGKPVQGVLSQRNIIPSGIGTFSRRDIYLGTLVFGFDIEKIIAKLEKNIADNNIGFAFLQNREFVFGSQRYERSQLENITKLLDKNNIETNSAQIISSQKLFSENSVTASIQKLKDYPFEIVIFYNQNTYHQELRDIFLQQILFIIATILACTILFGIIHKRIVRPISSVSQFAKKILELDFSYNADKCDAKELQDLFDVMNLLKESFKREKNLIDQLKLANSKIAQENFNKSEFISAISHDIRNPLAAIISFAQFIDEDKDLTISKEELAKDIKSCALDALNFINDLLDVSQASSGEFSVNLLYKINVAETIKRSVRINKNFARQRHIEITEEIDNNLEEINLDARRLKQILVNLISNSIKYSKENTEIIVSAKTIKTEIIKKLQIIVRDHGFGMTDEQITKAMQKFGVIENENSDKSDSFGLGLPLVKRLVDLQMGEMDIESRVGFGTKITLTFKY